MSFDDVYREAMHDYESPDPEAFGQPSRSQLEEDRIIDERDAKIHAATSDAEVDRIIREYYGRYGI